MAIKVPKDREVPFGAITPAPVKEQDLFMTSNWRAVRPILDNKKCTRCLTCYAACPDACWSFNEKKDRMEWNWKFCKGCRICIHECPSDALSAAPEARFPRWGGAPGKTLLRRNIMAREKMLSGCAAAAQGAKFAEVEVICSFPIRPYTAIMMELSKMVANGEIDAEFLHGEGEHAQVSVVLGASACGARAYTGSSGVGVTYAFEVYSPAAGGRYPLQMAIADRTLDPPGDFGSEHTDAMSARDQGWLMGWASTPQEVFDNTLINFRVGEDPKIMLPQFVCQDGYFLSHIPDKVVLPDIAQVREFLPPYAAPHPLSPVCPVSHGPQIRPDQGAPMDAQRAATFFDLPPVIEKAVADYNAIFKRKYGPVARKIHDR